MNGNQSTPMLPEPKKSVWLWVVLGAVVMAVLALVFYLYSFPSGKEGDTPPPSAAEEKAVNDLEKELQAESFDDLGAELRDIDKELAQ